MIDIDRAIARNRFLSSTLGWDGHFDRIVVLLGLSFSPDEGAFAEAVAEWQASRPPLDVDGIIGRGTWEVMRQELDLAPTAGIISTVGAWFGADSLAARTHDLDLARQLNINRCDLIVNDFSKQRSPTAFKLRSVSQIETFCEGASARNLEVHLMSWIMPHRSFIEGAAESLVPLCRSVGAASLQWDAEEPWTKAVSPMNYGDAAELVAESFEELGCPMGVNGICFTPTAKFGPLAAVCDYTVPQAYSTSTSGLRPGDGQQQCFNRYRDNFDKPIVMGLAAYRQTNIEGHTIKSAMTACIDEVKRLGCSTVIYWSFRQIKASSTVKAVIAGIRS